MSEYIERQAAIDALQEKVFHNLTDEFYGTMQVLTELPSADVVPVVRCRNCVHSAYDAVFRQRWCNLTSGVRKVKSDDFCSHGKRREE